LLVNCTIEGNSVERLIYKRGNNIDVKTLNTVFWNNDSDDYWEYNDDSGSNLLGKLDFQSDPMFVDLEYGNYQLLPDSPCIDSATDNLLPEDIFTDLAGNPRLCNGQIDLGAYEFQQGQCCVVATATPSPLPLPTPTDTPKQCKKGDVNCDRKVTPADALLVFQVYLMVSTDGLKPDCDITCSGDINNDGAITHADAYYILRKFVSSPVHPR